MEQVGGIPGVGISLVAVVWLIREMFAGFSKLQAKRDAAAGASTLDPKLVGDKAVMMERVRRIELLCERNTEQLSELISTERTQTANIDKLIEVMGGLVKQRARTSTPAVGIPVRAAGDGG